MIAKHVSMRTIGKSDFAELAKYITDEQGKSERLGDVRITNCQANTMQAVIAEVLATQRINTRAESDKTFHLLVSFRSGEQPSADTLKAIEDRICVGLGYGEHQRISAVHHDTDNLHIHIAINKIHPTRYTIHEPYQSYRALGELCQLLEREYGLEQDNHQSKRKIAEGRAADMEQHAGVESLVGWIKRECLAEIQAANSWSELHQVMRNNGLELRPRANGFVIESSDGTMVKASTVARDLSRSKLETRLGVFESSPEQHAKSRKRQYTKQPVRFRLNTAELYAEYKNEQHKLTITRANEWEKARGRKDRLISVAKHSNKLRRATIKLIGGSRLEKKILYGQAHKALRDELQVIHKKYQNERAELYDKYKRQAWADWLKQKALDGDNRALTALRAREAAKGLKGHTIIGKGGTVSGQMPVIDNITKKGTIIFRSSSTAIRDDGDKLQLSRQATGETVQEALCIAMERYGNRITVNGTAEFKAQVIRAAVVSQLPITFADPGLERRRQSLLINQENKHERSEQAPTDRGRTDRRGTGRAGSGAAADEHATRTERSGSGGVKQSSGYRAVRTTTRQRKPNVGFIGKVPPPQSQNRLRTLSTLGVVRIASGSEVLLPSNVSRHVEQQGAKSDNALRRGVFGPRVTQEHIAAVDKYIAEREEKRLKGFDIPKHLHYYKSGDTLTFTGIRNIDGLPMTLLKSGDNIMVFPIDKATVNRLSRIAIGDPVSVTQKGSIKTSKGRHR